jgi:hypothetical protein
MVQSPLPKFLLFPGGNSFPPDKFNMDIDRQ